MAQKVQLLLIDDLDGGEAAETVTFALDGRVYEIDLNHLNAQKLRETIEPFRRAGRRAGTTNLRARGLHVSRTSQLPPQPDDSGQIRHWAKRYGIPVNKRGRVAGEVREAYEACQRNDSEPLKKLLAVNNLDPDTEPAPETISTEPEAPTVITSEDRARITARQAGKLSKAQLNRLREAYADDKGLGISDGRSNATTYEALANRGLMRKIEENVYEITLAGRLWFEVHDISPAA